MAKITLTNDDGSTQDFNDQAYTDAAVAAAVAAVPAPAAGPVVTSLNDTSVVITHSDGSTQTFVVEAAAEAVSDAPAA